MKTSTLIVAAVVTTTLVSSMAQAQIRYVDDDAALGGDGLAWNTAYQFVQDALANAGAGTEIRVAQGTYTPDRDEGGNVTPGDRQATFRLLNGVSLIGGFAGSGEPDPNDRDVNLYPTILSGDLLGDDEPGFVNYDENSYQVLTAEPEASGALLSGFIVAAGNANGSESADRSGAGLTAAFGASLTITDCIFEENTADSLGGGIRDQSQALVLHRCILRGNRARGSGGGISSLGGLELVDCDFVENVASGSAFPQAGGLAAAGSGLVSNCRFIGNSAFRGGAMRVTGSELMIVDCSFISNSTSGSVLGNGGAVWNSGTPQFIGCRFIDNSTNGFGGAITNGGFGPFGSGTVVANCEFTGNSSPAVYNSSGFGTVLDITNCTFANSTWAILSDFITLNVSNSIFWNVGTPLQQELGELAVRYSLVQGGWPGAGNIDADPLFVDADGDDGVAGNEDDDLRLSPESPCIDAGDNTAVPLDITTDLDGNPRFVDDPDTVDTGNGTPPIVDMGAFEFQLGDDDDDDSSSDSSSDDSSSSDSSSDDSASDDSSSGGSSDDSDDDSDD